MTLSEIQANKPDGATHYADPFIEGYILYYKDDGLGLWLWSNNHWIKSIHKYPKNIKPL